MFLSGFTFIKNGLTLGYPILESVLSIEPICDEIIINVGFEDPECTKDDGTYSYLRDSLIGKKYKFLKSWWDPSLRRDGLILSQQTNIALKECKGKFCQYIQGDEVIHEDDLEVILDGLKEMNLNPHIMGLVFNYIHFYGNVDVYKYTRNVYRREVRTIRNHQGIQSYKDAQGFKDRNLDKLLCKKIDARILHYGWARKEQVMSVKIDAFEKLYHQEDKASANFKYRREWGMRPYEGTHPKVLMKWIEENKNPIDVLSLKTHYSFNSIGLIICDLIESLTGYRIGEYKPYKLLK